MKPSPPLDDYAREFLVSLWAETLLLIGEERFDAALKLTLETSTFRPDIATIRHFAGIPVVYPTEEEAKSELAKLLKLMRHHGRKLTNRGTPEKEPPAKCGPARSDEVALSWLFSDIVKDTIEDMGIGSVRAGLEAIWAHPSLDLVRPPDELDEMESFRAVAGEKIERKWVEYYTKRKAEGFKREAA